MRQRETDNAAPVPDIETVQGTGADANHDLTRPRLGIRRVFVTENIRPSVLVKPDSSHNPYALTTIGSPRLSGVNVDAMRS